MTKKMIDLKNYVADLQRSGRVDTIAAPLATDVRRRMEECLTEEELVGIDYLNYFVYNSDPYVCGSHDYLDANMVVLDAVADFSERVVGVPRDEFLEKALSAEEVQDADGAVLTLIKTGWNEVKRQGFSKLWSETLDDDVRRDLAVLVLVVPTSADASHALFKELRNEYDDAYMRIVGTNEDLGRKADALHDDDQPETVSTFIDAVRDAKAQSLTR